ncbi:5-cytosine rRNA methyltransferase NSUN4-like [Clavelina lepadiformis]|uniref:5-cytosine rRNA methyltransferase NSUN4-like n=1 Tax=Clavelina lepadiformis TaxID=159417 RepID=UPI00404271DF
MMNYRSSHLIARRYQELYTKFHRGKKKPSMFNQFRNKGSPAEIAKDYFDLNYSKVFKAKWPGMRCAMLSRKKYGNILNSYADFELYQDEILSSGAYDFISKLHENATEKSAELKNKINELEKEMSNESKQLPNEDRDEMTTSEVKSKLLEQNIDHLEELNSSLQTCSELEKVCMGVHAYVYPKGDFTEFKGEIKNSLYLSFFLDASSVLPVLALNPIPGDHILDLCAAPGGKFNIMVQSLGNSAHIVANDIDSKRGHRIKKVLKEYLPKTSSIHNHVKVVRFDGTQWLDQETEAYSKVLVDVPCTTDRISMYEPKIEYDNIFCNQRKRERGRLPEIQSNLLKNAILACQPGGTIVYSTCTASALQNEFVVQYTIQEMYENYQILCEVEDLSLLTRFLQDEFHFHKDQPIGTLVIPQLDANFGPTFVCRLHRVT